MRFLLLFMLLSQSLMVAASTTGADAAQKAHNGPSDRLFMAQLSNTLLPLEARAQTMDELTLARFKTLLPAIMRRNNLDMWIIIAREYNEDPIMKTLLPATWLSARRRTMLVFYDPGKGQELERLAVAKYDIGKLFERAWDEARYPDQYTALAQLISEREPARIGVNMSDHYGHADGLSATERQLLNEALPATYQQRLVSAQDVAVAWLETRTEGEMTHYKTLVETGHALISRAFSSAVVTPGKTTTAEIEWWLREQSAALSLPNWFHPTVSFQRPSATKDADFSGARRSGIVKRGDLLHVDFGMTYLNLNSDQQQHAYILRANETQAPAALRDALATGNRLQDILLDNFRQGRTGNQILASSRAQAIEEAITPMIYTHPIGFHGHGAGTTVGMWDAQEGVPIQGDYPLQRNTAYSIELNAAVAVPDWGGDVRIMLEEQALFDGERIDYMDGRQRQFHLIDAQ